MTTKTHFGLAAAAALFALSAGATSSVHAEGGKAKAEAVHCYGVNTCKGTSDCKSYNHDCKGMNDCKGQGFKELSAKKCAAMGGKTTEN
jgi:uncharacterized membrane protein